MQIAFTVVALIGGIALIAYIVRNDHCLYLHGELDKANAAIETLRVNQESSRKLAALRAQPTPHPEFRTGHMSLVLPLEYQIEQAGQLVTVDARNN